MLSIDTNILFHAFNSASPSHPAAYAWIASISREEDVAISEFILAELYGLLRNPAVLRLPLAAHDAVQVVDIYRSNPRWRLIGFPGESRLLHDALWRKASAKEFAFRRLYDIRTALTLIAQGVTDFATVNGKDFRSAGFRRVWNPLND